MSLTRSTRTLHSRWQVLQLYVRCALNVAQAGYVRQYLSCGIKLARMGAMDERDVQLRMLQTLLRTARDEALPWFWRSVCLEHTSLPLARLHSLVARHDPVAMRAIEAAVQRGRDELPAPY